MWQLHVIVSDSILMDWEKTTVKCVSAPLKVLHLHVGIPLYLNSAQCIPPPPCVLTLNGILHYARLMVMVMVIGGGWCYIDSITTIRTMYCMFATYMFRAI